MHYARNERDDNCVSITTIVASLVQFSLVGQIKLLTKSMTLDCLQGLEEEFTRTKRLTNCLLSANKLNWIQLNLVRVLERKVMSNCFEFRINHHFFRFRS